MNYFGGSRLSECVRDLVFRRRQLSINDIAGLWVLRVAARRTEFVERFHGRPTGFAGTSMRRGNVLVHDGMMSNIAELRSRRWCGSRGRIQSRRLPKRSSNEYYDKLCKFQPPNLVQRKNCSIVWRNPLK